jgi:hypothetical protein
MILTPMLAALAVYAPASLTGVWQYKALDEGGKVIAHGSMRFRPVKAEEVEKRQGRSGWTYFGTRQVTCVDPSKYGPHSEKLVPISAPHGSTSGSLKVGASLNQKAFSADLSEGWFDNNIILRGTLEGKSIKGEWYWGTFAGARIRGTFTLTPQPKPSR